MKQLSLSFMRNDTEEVRSQIKHAEDVTEEMSGGQKKYENERRIERAKDVLLQAESEANAGYNIGVHLQLCHHLVELVLNNLKQ
jgi:hypothetical protein